MNTRKAMAGALSASLLLGALPGIALAQDEAADMTDLSPEGVEWALDTLAGEPVPEDVEVSLFLSGGEVVGSAGCNSYFGSYELDGEALTFPNPFGVTLKMCEGPAMDVETAYLPLLQETATWAIDEEGALSLADAEDVVQLVYSEPPVEVTQSEVDLLVATIEDLQAEIDEATAELAAITAAAESINIDKYDKRLTAVEDDVEVLEERVGGISSKNLKNRIAVNEEDIAELQGKVGDINLTINKLRDRIKVLEATAEDHEARITALEQPPAAE